jgi:hypothetical protein
MDTGGNSKSSAALTITTLLPADTQNPVIVVGSGVMSASTIMAGGSISVTYRLTDDVGCCGYHQAWLYNQSGGVVQQVASNRISGTAKDGEYQISFNIPTSSPAGTYSIKAQATDLAGKYTHLQLLGSPVITTFVPLPTLWKEAYALNGTVIPAGRGGGWEMGFTNATRVNMVAESANGPTIVANYSQGPAANYVMATASYSGEPGKLLYVGGIAVPPDTPAGIVYEMTWTAINSLGQSIQIKSGSFTTG